MVQVHLETVSMQFPSLRGKGLLHWPVPGLLPPFSNKDQQDKLFPFMGAVVSLCCIHWTANLSISMWWFLFGICKSDYLGEKAGLWKKTWNGLSLLYGQLLSRGWLNSTLGNLPFCPMHQNKQFILGFVAAAAAVGGGFLRKDGIPEGVCNWKEIGSNNSAAE